MKAIGWRRVINYISLINHQNIIDLSGAQLFLIMFQGKSPSHSLTTHFNVTKTTCWILWTIHTNEPTNQPTNQPTNLNQPTHLPPRSWDRLLRYSLHQGIHILWINILEARNGSWRHCHLGYIWTFGSRKQEKRLGAQRNGETVTVQQFWLWSLWTKTNYMTCMGQHTHTNRFAQHLTNPVTWYVE